MFAPLFMPVFALCKPSTTPTHTTAAMPAETPDAPQHFTLHLPERAQSLPVAVEQTLLQALLSAGVAWPASCRNGACRVCMGQLASGRVRYTVPWPGLLPEEKAAGCVLPCVACAQSDVVLRGPSA